MPQSAEKLLVGRPNSALGPRFGAWREPIPEAAAALSVRQAGRVNTPPWRRHGAGWPRERERVWSWAGPQVSAADELLPLLS